MPFYFVSASDGTNIVKVMTIGKHTKANMSKIKGSS